jgi:hypothetical protein
MSLTVAHTHKSFAGLPPGLTVTAAAKGLDRSGLPSTEGSDGLNYLHWRKYSMRNDYEIRGDTTAIFIKRRNGDITEALIDTSELEKLLSLDVTWNLTWTGKRFQIRANKFNSEKTKTIGSILLNRYILDFPKDKEVSYVSENTLDNRKDNLRITSHSQSRQNQKGANINNSTGVRGVSYQEKWGKYIVNVNKKYIGAYDSLDEAEKIAVDARKKYYPYSTN